MFLSFQSTPTHFGKKSFWLAHNTFPFAGIIVDLIGLPLAALHAGQI
jgi:hypothetical protein